MLPITSRRLTIVFGFLLICLAVPSVPTFILQKAFSDGLFQENLPGIPIGGGKYAGLFVKINPVLIDGPQTLQNRYLELKFSDVSSSNTTIPHTTFDLSISKVSGLQVSNSIDEMPLLHDKFHSHTGSLTLEVADNNTPATIGSTTINIASGQHRDSFYGAWLADNNGTVYIQGPLFSDGGLYHLHVVILGYGADDNTVAPSQIPPFDAWLSIGSATHYSVSFDQRSYNLTLISYYDNTKSFSFDLGNRSVDWAIPFVWNQQHIEQQQINVHEEVRIPKALIADMQSGSFSPFIDGVPLTNRAVYLDPYSSAVDMTIHYIIQKDTILELQHINATGLNPGAGRVGQMQFSFLINGPKILQTSTYLRPINPTSQNPIGVSLQWSPDLLAATRQTTVKISFLESGAPVNGIVMYSMKIRPMTNVSESILVDRENLEAVNGTDLQQVTFPDNNVYSVEIDVQKIKDQQQYNSKDTLASSANGLVTKGIVVVPEFGAGSIAVVIAMVMIPVILAPRLIRLRNAFDYSKM